MGSLNIAVFCALVTFICFAQLKAENNEVEAQDESSKKHILVFGGNGFIGASTVIKLLQRGYTVHTVNRFEFQNFLKKILQSNINSTIFI